MMSGVRDAPGGGEVLVTVPSPPDTYPPQWDNILMGLKGSGKEQVLNTVKIGHS